MLGEARQQPEHGRFVMRPREHAGFENRRLRARATSTTAFHCSNSAHRRAEFLLRRRAKHHLAGLEIGDDLSRRARIGHDGFVESGEALERFAFAEWPPPRPAAAAAGRPRSSCFAPAISAQNGFDLLRARQRALERTRGAHHERQAGGGLEGRLVVAEDLRSFCEARDERRRRGGRTSAGLAVEVGGGVHAPQSIGSTCVAGNWSRGGISLKEFLMSRRPGADPRLRAPRA